MSNVLRSLVIKVGADLTGAQAGLKQAAKDFKSTGKDLTTIGSGLTAGVTMPILGIGAAIGFVVKDAANAEKYVTQLDAALKSTGGAAGMTRTELLDLAEGFEQTTKFSAEMALNAESLLLTFTNIGKDTFPRATKATADMATALGTDMAGQSIALGKALNDPIKGITALTRVGVSFTAEQKNSIKAMQESGDMAGAQTLILQELEKEFGGSAEAAGKTFAGQLVVAKNEIMGATEAIGKDMIPVLMELMPIVKKDIVPAIQGFASVTGDVIEGFDDLSDPIKAGIVGFIGLAAAVGPVVTLAGKYNLVMSTVSGLLLKASGAIAVKTAAEIAETGAVTALTAAEGAAVTGAIGLQAALGPILISAAAVGAAVYLFATRTGELTKETKDLAKSCQESEKAFRDQSTEAVTNAAVTKKLADELYALSDTENKSNAEKAKMKELTSQINSLMPELNITIDEQTGALSKNKAEVLKLIDAKLKDIRLQAAQERLLELYKEDVELSGEMRRAQEKLTAAKNKGVAETLASVNAHAKAGHVLMSYVSETDDAQAAIDALTQEQKNNKASVSELEREYGNMAATVAGTSSDIAEASQITTVLTEEELAQQLSNLEEYQANMEKSVSDHLTEMGEIDQNGIEQSKLTAAEIKANLEQQIIDFQNWRTGINDLSSKVPTDVLEDLRELGPGMAPVIEELNGMTDEELAAWVAVWREKGALAKDAAIDELGTLPTEATRIARETGFNFGEALKQSVSEIVVPPIQLTTTFTSRMNLPKPPGFAVGTRYLPSDMIIQAHEGELIVPKAENPYANSGGPGIMQGAAGAGISKQDFLDVMRQYGKEFPTSLSLDGKTVATSTNESNAMRRRQLGKAVTE